MASIKKFFKKTSRAFKLSLRDDIPVRKRKGAFFRVSVTCSAFALAIITIFALIIPLRPTFSQLEQRNLTEFPEFTMESFLSGQFFDDINTWYADTFTFRESYMAVSNALKTCYGVQSESIVGTTVAADDIPTGDNALDTTEGTESLEVGTESLAVETTESTEAETESTLAYEIPLPDTNPNEEGETVDNLMVVGDTAYSYYGFNQERADIYVETINRAGSVLKGKANVYCLVAPTSIGFVAPERIREQYHASNQVDAINYFYSNMDSTVKTVNAITPLQEAAANGEYVAFRTDHHWTADGAYVAYQAFCKVAKITAADKDTDFIKHEFDGFLGTFYSKTQKAAMKNNPDTVYAYEPKDTNTINVCWQDGTNSDYSIIKDVSTWAANSKYGSCFIAGDQPFDTIVNPNINDGSSILVIKESYGNCFVPFLVENYQYVYVVDYRHFYETQTGSLASVVSEYNIQNVLFINTINTTGSKTLTTQLQAFIQ